MKEAFCEKEKQEFDYKSHWDSAYLKTKVNNLGWYEENPTPSLVLIEECNLPKNSLIFNAGAGASTLINELLNRGYSNIIVNDISSTALTSLKGNLSHNDSSSEVKYIIDDLTNPIDLLKIKNVDVWHDRAVLHFFTEVSQQNNYFQLIRNSVKSGGFVILAEFNLNGAKKCSGLEVVYYDEKLLQEKLGNDFDLLKSFNYTYTQPSGSTREYVYTLFKRKL